MRGCLGLSERHAWLLSGADGTVSQQLCRPDGSAYLSCVCASTVATATPLGVVATAAPQPAAGGAGAAVITIEMEVESKVLFAHLCCGCCGSDVD